MGVKLATLNGVTVADNLPTQASPVARGGVVFLALCNYASEDREEGGAILGAYADYGAALARADSHWASLDSDGQRQIVTFVERLTIL